MPRAMSQRILPRSQRGAGLVEVMIGLFVLAIGLLGMASLQNNAVRANNTAHLYSQATFLASDIVERMRANRYVLDDYKAGFNDNIVAGTDCSAVECTDQQMAKWDVAQWRADLAASLPQGEGQIEVDGVDDDEVTIQIKFDDDSGDQADEDDDPYELQVNTRI